ncbi:hypothetical protein [Eubacterium ramulus]
MEKQQLEKYINEYGRDIYLFRNRAQRGQERSVIRNSKRVSVREHTFL